MPTEYWDQFDDGDVSEWTGDIQINNADITFWSEGTPHGYVTGTASRPVTPDSNITGVSMVLKVPDGVSEGDEVTIRWLSNGQVISEVWFPGNGDIIFNGQTAGSTSTDTPEVPISYDAAAGEQTFDPGFFDVTTSWNGSIPDEIEVESPEVWVDDFAYTTPDPPNAPVDVSQTVTGNTAISVTASEDTSGGSVDQFRIEVSEDDGAWTHVALVSPAGMPYEYAATASVDTHRFRIRAENGGGNSDWTYTTTKSTDITTVTPTNVTATSVALSWDQADDATEYDVLIAESTGSSEGDYAVDQTVTGTSATVSGLENGERYHLRPIARYPQDDSLGVEVAITTDVVPPVIDSIDTSVQREITVHYSVQDNSSDGNVVVKISQDGGSTWSQSKSVEISQTQATFTALPDGEEYTVVIERSTDHESAQSNAETAKTILPPPLDLTHPQVGATTADYSWTPQHNNGDTRLEYKPSDTSEWQHGPVVGHEETTATVTGLRNLEEYDTRVVATTDHAETEDQ